MVTDEKAEQIRQALGDKAASLQVTLFKGAELFSSFEDRLLEFAEDLRNSIGIDTIVMEKTADEMESFAKRVRSSAEHFD